MSIRIAMWSGPRNLSTAMMRSFENRDDCIVSDEPLYAHYLSKTGLEHPGAAEVMSSQPCDWQTVTRQLTGDIPEGASVWYQKHMTHHLLPNVGRDWLSKVKSCFLIRDPHEVLASYVKRRHSVTLDDLGYPQQSELFRMARKAEGQSPIVIDSGDVLRAPEAMLKQVCELLDIEFSNKMLHWPAGPRDSDGVWAPHWYASVKNSTGFMPWTPRKKDYPNELKPLIDEAVPYYEELHAHRVRLEH